MQQFTIRDMERLSGIKTHTLRMWEQRYGIIQPGRKQSQHRLYSNDDLKELLRVVHLYNKGHRISHIAKMGRDGIHQRIQSDIEAGEFYQTVIEQLQIASMEFDEMYFQRILAAIKLELGISETMEKVVYPFLERIGLLWMNNKLIPCQEHFASNLIRQMLITEINAVPLPNDPLPSRIILFTPPAEYHEIPLLYMQFLLKYHGIGSINLGCNVPLEGLEIMATKRPIEILHFHLITNLGTLSTQEYFERLCQRFPDKAVVMSGIETRNVTHVPYNGRIIHNAREFYMYLKDRLVAEGILKSLN